MEYNKDVANGQWNQIMGRAKAAWAELTDDELLHVEGDAQKLSGLIQKKYGIAREKAERQVKRFFEETREGLNR
jgi:Uncharacterized protein conserved in bacteria